MICYLFIAFNICHCIDVPSVRQCLPGSTTLSDYESLAGTGSSGEDSRFTVEITTTTARTTTTPTTTTIRTTPTTTMTTTFFIEGSGSSGESNETSLEGSGSSGEGSGSSGEGSGSSVENTTTTTRTTTTPTTTTIRTTPTTTMTPTTTTMATTTAATTQTALSTTQSTTTPLTTPTTTTSSTATTPITTTSSTATTPTITTSSTATTPTSTAIPTTTSTSITLSTTSTSSTTPSLTTASTSTTTGSTTSCIGSWSSWAPLIPCNDTCGACGTWNLTRTCLTPTSCPCIGPSKMIGSCNFTPCAFPRRSCCYDYKIGAASGQFICTNGSIVVSIQANVATETTTVSANTCGVWSEWTASGSCSESCGAFGFSSYSRTCTTPSSCPCSGPSTKMDHCNFQPCVYPLYSCTTGYSAQFLNGQVLCGIIASTSISQIFDFQLSSTWGSWSACTDTCGFCGTQTRTRASSNSNDPSFETQNCNQIPCTYPRDSCCYPYSAMFINNQVICSR